MAGDSPAKCGLLLGQSTKTEEIPKRTSILGLKLCLLYGFADNTVVEKSNQKE